MERGYQSDPSDTGFLPHRGYQGDTGAAAGGGGGPPAGSASTGADFEFRSYPAYAYRSFPTHPFRSTPKG